MGFRCFLFDHDDTLLPTFALRARALTATAREVLGDDGMDAAGILDASHGRTLEQMADDIAAGDAALAARTVAAYRRHYYVLNRTGLVPFPGIPEALRGLREAGVRVGVVTSKLGSGARDELDRTGLGAHIEHLTAADDVRTPKPAAEPILRAMAALEARPEHTVMVGDTSADILGARAAGVASAAALWGVRDRDALLALAPDHALETPQALLALA